MAEKYKLGLSRNRLFEFENTVVFRGKYKELLNEEDAVKAMKMLSFKEQIITANIQLSESSEAYIVTQAVEPEITFSHLSAEEIAKSYEKKPLLFTEKLFEFTVSQDGYLVVAGHTAVCDGKSLLRLASCFIGFYEKSNMSIEPNAICTFSEPKSLPVDVISPIVNKLSSELDNKWQRVQKKYSLEEYLSAREQYIKNLSDTDVKKAHIPTEKLLQYISFCDEAEVDFSSLLYFCFYKAICNNIHHEKNASKMRVSADRRFFHGTGDRFSVGAYNGSVCISLSKAENKKSEGEQLRAFHLDTYKALTSPFRVFSDEILLANVQVDLCDASYMCLAGLNKSKMVKDFAKTYGCMNRELCDCFYYNLTQRYWSNLQSFGAVMVEEPFRRGRAPLLLCAVEDGSGCNINLRYSTVDIGADVAEKVIAQAISHLESIVKQ